MPWYRIILRAGLVGSLIALHLTLVGMVEAFNKREIIRDVVTLGQLLLLSVGIGTAAYALRRLPPQERATGKGWAVSLGAVTLVAATLGLLAMSIQPFNLRFMFQNASPALVEILTFGSPGAVGLVKLWLFFLVSAGLTMAYLYLPLPWNRILAYALGTTALMGILRALVVPLLPDFIAEIVFTPSGLSLAGAGIMLVFWSAFYYYWPRWWARWQELQRLAQSADAGPARRKVYMTWLGLILVLLLLPAILQDRGSYLFEVLDMVGIYIIMGLGLNIVVGFAGLLDLGYVAFFAIGAYTMAVLTTSELPFVRQYIPSLNFWEALPFALLLSLISGILLGVPVLKTRGDYLAIITLGFGEIIRLLVISDLLKPVLGGAQGITGVARPTFGSLVINDSWEYFYFILAVIALGLFISIRLRDSRLGRAWKAIREDEDVAVAMGIDHVAAKLTAFATGALLAGMAGALFSSRLYSIAPHSFNVLISINVLCLLIVGGMGSLPGVVVGALALVGLPELLREFAEFRLLVYGAALVIMMLYKPEGLWPERARVSRVAREVFGDRLHTFKLE